MTTKTITMTVTDGNSHVTMREVFDSNTTWMALAYQFHKFLAAQGYHLDNEAVGADVEAYILSTETFLSRTLGNV